MQHPDIRQQGGAMHGIFMPKTAPDPVAHLHAEPARCDRIAMGLSDGELVARLTGWAAAYRRDAHRLSLARHAGRPMA